MNQTYDQTLSPFIVATRICDVILNMKNIIEKCTKHQTIRKNALNVALQWFSGKEEEIEKYFGDVLIMMNDYVIDEETLFDRL